MCTFARSKKCPGRDGAKIVNYTIQKNTAFLFATNRSPRNGLHYFFCNNLPREEQLMRYMNERAGWQEHYVSTIVVPIQGPEEKRELVGFLTIDSLATDCFSEESNVQILAAFADQMYNYFALSDELTKLRGANKKPKRA